MTTHEKDQSGQADHRDSEEAGGQTEAGPSRAHLSVAGLRIRGWTAGMIRRLLGEPDLRRANPYFRTAPQTRLYSVERVEAAERSEEFRAVSAAAARRSAAVKEAALRRRREVLARIAAEPIDVPVLAPDRLTALAVEHRDRQAGDQQSGSGTPDSWKVDYLCHRLARYDGILDELSGRTGRAAAERLLRRRIHTAIARTYPELAHECERRSCAQECGPSPG